MGEIHEPYICLRYFRGRYKGESWTCKELLGHDGPCSVDRRGALPTFAQLQDQENTRRFRCLVPSDIASALQWARPGDQIIVANGTTLAGEALPFSVRITVEEIQ